MSTRGEGKDADPYTSQQLETVHYDTSTRVTGEIWENSRVSQSQIRTF